jgi:hypothetical protein
MTDSLHSIAEARRKVAARIAVEYPFTAADVQHCLGVFEDEEYKVRAVLNLACHLATETPLLDAIDAFSAVLAEADIRFVDGNGSREIPRGLLNS